MTQHEAPLPANTLRNADGTAYQARSLEEHLMDVLTLGLQTDGAHHKQWALWQIGNILGLDMSGITAEKGIAP